MNQIIYKPGDKGDGVKRYQLQLNALGFKECFYNGEFRKLDIDGDYGPVTTECTSNLEKNIIDAAALIDLPADFRKKYTMGVDGIYDTNIEWIINNMPKIEEFYHTRAKPPGFEDEKLAWNKKMNSKEQILYNYIKLAKEQIGVREVGSSNSGIKVNQYISTGSCGQISCCQPWCMFVMNWILVQVCKAHKIKYPWLCNGYTPYAVNTGTELGITIKNPKLSEVQVGDWGFIYSSARDNANHIFLIIAKGKNGVTTLEGNTNPGGSRDGYGFFQRYRSTPWAIVRWIDLFQF